jgi:AraC-like DNA-binding protein
MHLRYDGCDCFTFGCSTGKVWLHPHVFLYDPEVWLLGEKLLKEMRALSGAAQPVALLYWQLILRLLLRSIAEGKYDVLRTFSHLLYTVEPQPSTHPALPSQTVNAATAFIHSALSDPQLSGRVVAQRIGLSERHLSRLFQREIGVTPGRYIQQKRGEKACDMLSHLNGAAIGEIAAHCGFKRPAVFSTWFARRFGSTPSAYRRRQRAGDVGDS